MSMGAGTQHNDTARLTAVARGEAEPDLVVHGARVFCAFTREWLDADVAVSGGRVAGLGSYPGGVRRIDASGRALVPGLIDAHLHIESAKLTPRRFAEAVLAHGTTAVVAEPHEIGNVLGVRGVEWFMDACNGLALDVFFMAPSCVPASDFESPGAAINPDDMARLLAHARVLGIGEMMNFPGVIGGAPGELAKLAVRGAGQHVDGHAPGVRPPLLDAYAAAGIGSDHESTTWEEALDKRRRGMWVLLREASNARNLVDLLPLVREHGTDWCAMCTDDREPDMLLREGHINQMCRVAVANGLAPEDALVLATLNAARAHGLQRAGHGAIAPGWLANMVLLDDLTSFEPRVVIARGELAAGEGAAPTDTQGPGVIPDWVTDTVRVQPVTGSSFAIAAGDDPDAASVRVRAIGTVEGQLLTRSLEVDAPVSDGLVHADPDSDLAKIAVVERHRATGRIGTAFVRGFGLRRGAFASTVAHDAHNIVVVGTDDDSMATCVSRLAELGGGIVAAAGDDVLAELALPVAGLMSDEPVADVAAGMDACHAALAGLGVSVDAPFMILSFLALSVIPSLKLTDRGLVDVDRFELVPLHVGAAAGAPA
jgi:adenine deaminase